MILGKGLTLWIETMSVRNFRCFAQQDFSFHPEFNVLIGDNSAGKTAILEALSVVAGSWLENFPGIDRPSIAAKNVRVVGRMFGSRFALDEENPTIVDATLLVYGRSLKIRHVRMTTRSDEETAPVPQVMPSDNYELRELARNARRSTKPHPIDWPIIAYYGAERFVRSEEAGESDKSPLTQQDIFRNEGYRDCMKASAGPQLFTRWMEYEDRVAYQEKIESPAYQAVKIALTGILEGATEIRYDSKRLEVVVAFEGSRVFPFGLLSDGQRNMLALAGDIASRMARLNPHLDGTAIFETPGIVLIDELDLHLHPRWQRHVAADLRRTFPNVQFIVTTHSPQIIGEVEPECVIALENYRVAEPPTQSEGMDTNFILRNVMHASERHQGTTEALRAIETLIGEDEYESAQERIDALRSNLGPFPELTSLQTRIDRIRLLGDKR